ncbi:MAG: M23 family metallopeptidase [Bacteroidetes bacterium]|nr:M23 family metallopeptidase [Bacteroidota bacterium]
MLIILDFIVVTKFLILKKKNKILSKLKEKYQVILRNSENFEEKNIVSFNYYKLIFIVFAFIFFSISTSTFIIRKVFGKWIDPAYIEVENEKKLNKFNKIINLLENKINIQTEFINQIQEKLKNNNVENIDEEIDRFEKMNEKVKKLNSLKKDYEEKISTNDNEFDKADKYIRANKELEIKNLEKLNSISGISFFAPINGVITSKLNHSSGHYGIDIVAKKNEPIKSIAEGIVVFSDWTAEGGNVIIIQHKKNLLSIYKHNSQLLKREGNFVKKGDAIAIIGNSGEFSTGPHLHFEMWYNGSPIDPEEYIVFDFNNE